MLLKGKLLPASLRERILARLEKSVGAPNDHQGEGDEDLADIILALAEEEKDERDLERALLRIDQDLLGTME